MLETLPLNIRMQTKYTEYMYIQNKQQYNYNHHWDVVGVA